MNYLADIDSNDLFVYDFPFRPIGVSMQHLTGLSDDIRDYLYWKHEENKHFMLIDECPLTVGAYTGNGKDLVIVNILPDLSKCIGLYQTKGVTGEVKQFLVNAEYNEKREGFVVLYMITEKDVFRCLLDDEVLNSLKPERIFLRAIEYKLVKMQIEE